MEEQAEIVARAENSGGTREGSGVGVTTKSTTVSSRSVRVGLVKWGNPWGAIDQAPQWGLRVNGAYVVRGREVLLYDTKGEALAAKREISAKLTPTLEETP